MSTLKLIKEPKDTNYWKLKYKTFFSYNWGSYNLLDEAESKYRDNHDYDKTLVSMSPFVLKGILGMADGASPSIQDIVMSPLIIIDRDWPTIPHEIGHTLGLEHSFDRSNGMKFKKGKTENVMDYIYLDKKTGKISLSSWKWQWDKIQEDTDDLDIQNKKE